MYIHDPHFILTVYHYSVVRHVEKVGRAVDVIHGGNFRFLRAVLLVHLSRMRHQNDEAGVEPGKTCQTIHE